jgi:hypothetical protein
MCPLCPWIHSALQGNQLRLCRVISKFQQCNSFKKEKNGGRKILELRKIGKALTVFKNTLYI